MFDVISTFGPAILMLNCL